MKSDNDNVIWPDRLFWNQILMWFDWIGFYFTKWQSANPFNILNKICCNVERMQKNISIIQYQNNRLSVSSTLNCFLLLTTTYSWGLCCKCYWRFYCSRFNHCCHCCCWLFIAVVIVVVLVVVIVSEFPQFPHLCEKKKIEFYFCNFLEKQDLRTKTFPNIVLYYGQIEILFTFCYSN